MNKGDGTKKVKYEADEIIQQKREPPPTETGKTAQQSRAPAVLSEGTGSIPSTYMTADIKTLVPGHLMFSLGFYAHSVQTYMQNTHTYKIKMNKYF